MLSKSNQCDQIMTNIKEKVTIGTLTKLEK